VGCADTAVVVKELCGALPQTKGGISGVPKQRLGGPQRLKEDAAHDDVPDVMAAAAEHTRATAHNSSAAARGQRMKTRRRDRGGDGQPWKWRS